MQLATLFLLAAAIWLAGSPRTGNGAAVYRHVLPFSSRIPLRSGSALRCNQSPGTLGGTELFQSRGTRLLPRGVVSWIAFIISSLARQALRVVWPIAIAVPVAPPACVIVAGVSTLILSLVILLLTIFDERLDFILDTMTN